MRRRPAPSPWPRPPRDPTPLIAALSETFDAALARRFAFASRAPAHIAWLLLAGALLSVGAIGAQLGLGPHRHRAMSVLLITMWTGGLLLIVDLNRPRQGRIQRR